MKYSFDRLEGPMAVLIPEEGGNPISPRVEELPAEARPGDTLLRQADGWVLLAEESAERRRRILEKRSHLFKDD